MRVPAYCGRLAMGTASSRLEPRSMVGNCIYNKLGRHTDHKKRQVSVAIDAFGNVKPLTSAWRRYVFLQVSEIAVKWFSYLRKTLRIFITRSRLLVSRRRFQANRIAPPNPSSFSRRIGSSKCIGAVRSTQTLNPCCDRVSRHPANVSGATE